MPPTKKKLSAEDEKLIVDVKAELEKPETPSGDEKTADASDLDDTDKTPDKSADENENPQAGSDVVEDTPEDAETDKTADAVKVHPVYDPCRVCFPTGWPAPEQGAFVNCAHGHAIVFGGEPVYIDRERAVELGFIKE